MARRSPPITLWPFNDDWPRLEHIMKNKQLTCKCHECYWASQCGDNTETACDDFTPLNSCNDIEMYEEDLSMRHEIYSEFAMNYSDSLVEI